MSKKMTMTSAGKLGDCIMQFPVAYWWHKETGKLYDFWLDIHTCKPLETLIAAQPGCESVLLREGIENWNAGGQPWHWDLKAEDHTERQFCHFGFRSFPTRQLTLQTMHDTHLNLAVDQITLANTPYFTVPDEPKQNRLLIHGMGICTHNRQTPKVWDFISRVRRDLEVDFAEIVFIGSPDDRAVGMAAYPEWKEYDDGGDFLKLGGYMNASRMVIGCGSAMAAFAGALCVPCIRVHDEIGGSKTLWSNLGSNQLNATELELRSLWPEWRDQFIREGVAK